MAPQQSGLEESVEEKRPSLADAVNQLSRFEGPPEEFLAGMLATQCRIAASAAGAVLIVTEDGQTVLLAVWPAPPEGLPPPGWVEDAAKAVGQAVAAGRATIRPLHGPDDLYGQPAQRSLILVPLQTESGPRGAAAFVIQGNDPARLADSRDRLELTSGLLRLYEARLALYERRTDIQRLRTAVEVLATVNENTRFTAAGMAMCNEVAARWGCDRVSFGVLRGRYVKVRAMSHTEKFSRKMRLVQDIEAAMEECLDQDIEVLYPRPEGADYFARAAGELSVRQGPTAIVALPIRRDGDPVAVLTAERPMNHPMKAEEIESLRLACELASPRLLALHDSDRWFGAKMAAGIRKGLGVLVGPKHTWLKLVVFGVLAAAAFLWLAKGTYHASAKCALQAIEQQVVSPPFGGFIEQVFVEPGEPVQAGRKLFALDTTPMRIDLHKAQEEREAYLIEARAMLGEGKLAEKQIAEAQAKKLKAAIDKLEYMVGQATVRAKIDGYVMEGDLGDLTQQRHRRVEPTDALYLVAPIRPLRAELRLDEDLLADLQRAMALRGGDVGGKLAVTAAPDTRVPFAVERIDKVAEVVDEKNVFRVRVKLHETPSWMRPGMEGVAKIDIGRRRYAWIWTRRLVNWLRMKLWL